MNTEHFKTLDAFRGICACIVAMFHFHANSIIQDVSFFHNAAVYVDFFFVLSGFVIFANYEERLRNGYNVWKFILLRFGRLWPLHISILMAFIFVDLFQLCFDVGAAAKFAPFSAPGEGIGAIVANIFMVHSLGILDRMSFNGPSWSISVEFYTYIIFALILITFRKKPYIAIMALCFVSVSVLFYFNGALYTNYNYGILRCIFGFSLGAFAWKLYRLFSGNIRPVLNNKGLASLIEFSLLIVLLLCVHYLYNGYSSVIFPPLFAILVLIFAHEAGTISHLLNGKIFQTIGLLSYSIYMTHIFISGKFFELPIRIIEQRTDLSITIMREGKPLYGETLLQGTLIEAIYLMVVIVISFISYNIIENPGRKFSRKLAGKIFPENKV